MSEPCKFEIRLKLEGELAERFRQIKKARGLTANTEVLRLMINEYYEKLLTKEAGKP